MANQLNTHLTNCVNEVISSLTELEGAEHYRLEVREANWAVLTLMVDGKWGPVYEIRRPGAHITSQRVF